MKKDYSKLDIDIFDIETDEQYATLSDPEDGDNGFDFPWPTI
jgi:hypothetical protein